MSYSIIYARQFVRTTRGIIPIVLIGENNVTRVNPLTGRESRARDWDLYVYRRKAVEMLEAPEATILELVYEAWKDTDPDKDLGTKYQGKWLTPKTEIALFKNGIKRAKTLEEIREENPGQSVRCQIVTYDKELNREILMEKDCLTTEALESWIDAAKRKYEALQIQGISAYICMGFWGEKPLVNSRHPQTDKPVIAKSKGRYVCGFTGNSLSVHKNDASKAHVFDSVDQARALLPKAFAPYSFVDAANAQKPKPYALKISKGSRAGYYVSKLTAHTLYYDFSAKAAKKFHSESEARRWFDKHIGASRFSGVEAADVVNVLELSAP